MVLAIVGGVLLLAGGSAILLGVLPVADALTVFDRVWPILLFVVAITVVAELAASAGLFDAVAGHLARWARRRTWLLWALIVGMATLSTAFLSLDTTAVLLTPVVVAVARAHRLDPLPFAFTTVWLANTASLLLPVSNLTNLLAAERSGASPLQFLGLMGAPAAVAVIVTSLLVWAFHRRTLRGSFASAPDPVISDRPQLILAAVVVVVLLPLLVSGMPPWIPALAAAVVLIAVFAWRSPRALRLRLIPWQLVVFASGLFLAVAALGAAGFSALLGAAAGGGQDLPALLRLSGVGALGANLANNLPAYLALEPAGDSPARLGALLIGVDAGPLITPWASLATLLWHERLRSLGVEVPWRRFVLLGLVVAPIVVTTSVVALWASV